MKQNLHITFINPNAESEIVQAMSGVIAYNLAENNETIKFDFSNTKNFQNSYQIEKEMYIQKIEYLMEKD